MTQQQQNLINDVLSLPVQGQFEVAKLVAQLKGQQQPVPSNVSDFANETFVGLWKDRQDLTDSSDWVRNVRRSEW